MATSSLLSMFFYRGDIKGESIRSQMPRVFRTYGPLSAAKLRLFRPNDPSMRSSWVFNIIVPPESTYDITPVA